MPNINSYADVVLDWEGLLTAARQNTELLPSMEIHRSALEQHLTLSKEVKARQESHAAGRQAATQELQELITRGRELAIRLRGVIRADIGPKSERLVQFRVTPLRRRCRRRFAVVGL